MKRFFTNCSINLNIFRKFAVVFLLFSTAKIAVAQCTYTDTYYVAKSGNDGTGAANDPALPYQTLQAAIDAAVVSGSAIISIATDNYTDNELGVSGAGASANGNCIQIEGNNSTITGTAASIGFLTMSGTNMTLSNLTITGFNRTGSLTVNGTDWTIDNVTADANESANFSDISGTGTVNNSTFSNNENGAMEISGSSSNITFDNTIFSCNSRNTAGGALTISSATAVFNNGSFANNYSSSQGGAADISGGANVTFNGTNFSENIGNGGNGGALNILSSSTVDINGGIFAENQVNSTNEGGAIYITGGSSNPYVTVNIDDVLFYGNVSVSGDGGAINKRNNCNVTINNSLFVLNSGGDGSAIMSEGTTSGATLNVDQCTFTQNGGADDIIQIASSGHTENITNCIIFDNNNSGTTITGGSDNTAGTVTSGVTFGDCNFNNAATAPAPGSAFASTFNPIAATACTNGGVSAGDGTTFTELGTCAAAGPVPVTGTLFNDGNGLSNSMVDGTAADGTSAGPLGIQMYVNIVSGGAVIASATVAADGTFNIPNVPANATGYTAVLTTSATSVTPTLPAGWEFTGDDLGTNNTAGSGTDATTPGEIALGTSTNSISDLLFGVNQIPEVMSMTVPNQSTPSGTDNVEIAALNVFGASDPESTITSITITTFPAGVTSFRTGDVTYYINSGAVPGACPSATCLAFPAAGVNIATDANGVPTSLTADPSFEDTGTIVFDYTTTDEAGSVSATGQATVQFSMAALPVELVTFSAIPQRCEVALTWQTASEINNAYFEVQRSRDGQTFEMIEKVEGAGTTSVAQQYQFMDKNPLTNNYYRLKQVDFNGQFAYSTIEIAQTEDCHGNGQINAYPNPVHNELTIELTTTKASDAQVIIFDYTGKQVLQLMTNVENGLNTLPVETTTLQAGIYFVQMTYDDEVSAIVRFVKK